MWEDFKEAKSTYPNADTMAVNAIGSYVPGKLTYWFSLHCYYLKVWHQVRKMLYKGDATYQAPILFSLRHTGEGVQRETLTPSGSLKTPPLSVRQRMGVLLKTLVFLPCVLLWLWVIAAYVLLAVLLMLPAMCLFLSGSIFNMINKRSRRHGKGRW